MQTEINPDTPLARFLATRDTAELVILENQIKQEIASREKSRSVLEAEIGILQGQLASVAWARNESALGRPAASSDDEARPVAETSKPPLRRAIVALMNDSERAEWTKDEILVELESRGWAPEGDKPANTLGNRLSELVARTELVRIGTGKRARYKLPDPGPSEWTINTTMGVGNLSFPAVEDRAFANTGGPSD